MTEQKTTSKKIQVPAALFLQMIDALRNADRDSRRNDRVLHDATRDMVADACLAISDWQDARLRKIGGVGS